MLINPSEPWSLESPHAFNSSPKKLTKEVSLLINILLIDEGQILLPLTKNDYYVFATEFKIALSSNA